MPADTQSILRLAMAGAHEGRADEALARLREVSDPHAGFTLQNQLARLARTLSPKLTNLPTLRVAFLAGSTIDPLIDSLRTWLLLGGFRLEAYNAPFDSWRQEALNPTAGLYTFAPDVVWFFLTARDLHFDNVSPANDAVVLRDIAGSVATVSTRCKVPVFVNNAEASAVRVSGNLEGSSDEARAGRIRKHNLALAASLVPGATVFDLAHQAACFGLRRFEDARLWFHSKHPFALDAFGPVGFAASRLLLASRGRSRKCIVVDLDNTLWGGVVGDDAPVGIRIGAAGGAAGEAFVAFQTYLKALSARGVALAVCSKNDESLAREPFRLRSEMVLGLDDFAVFRANWSNKADNLRAIAGAMNIGTDALVFVDDNPAERELVRRELPEVAVVELPDDPSDYVAALAAGQWFETLAISVEDRARTQAYRDNAARAQEMAGASDMAAYLRGLDMHASWGLAEPARMPRMSQLLIKTNQFQLTDRRYSEAELSALAADPNHWAAWFSLRDRFGDHGLISVVVVRIAAAVAHIEAWAMSCRVFARGMEDLVFRVLWRELARRGCTRVVGRYVASSKNGVVGELYERLGGRRDAAGTGSDWHFDLTRPQSGVDIFITEHTSAAPAMAPNSIDSDDKATP
jgi:FkbH-like protein